MMTAILLVTVVSCLFTVQVHAYPSGAPEKVCVGPMIPHHHKNEPQPASTSPLTVFNATWDPDGETMSVHIESSQPIKGVFIQGRKKNGNEPIGTFINIPPETHLVKCPTGDGVTHNAPQKWTQLTLKWKKPAETNKDETIQFWATIVVNFKTFWVVKSIE